VDEGGLQAKPYVVLRHFHQLMIHFIQNFEKEVSTHVEQNITAILGMFTNDVCDRRESSKGQLPIE